MKGKNTLLSLRKNKVKAFVFLVLMLIAAIILWPKPPKKIAIAQVKTGNLSQKVSASGSIYAKTSVDLNFLAGGKLVYLGVQKGSEVKKGQVLASLDQRTIQTNLENALIDYSKQRRSFEDIKKENNGHTPEDALSDAMKKVLENNQYDLDKAVNSVELQSLAREQANLISPISGIITRVDPQTSGVNIAATSVISVADPSELIFKIDVDESDIGKISIGQTITISLDAFPNTTIKTTVDSIDFLSHTTTTGGTVYTVQAKIDSRKSSYRLGMNGDADITVDTRKNVMIIPLSCLIDDTHVYVKKGKTFVKQKVKLGLQSDTESEVISGLQSQDQVAILPDDVEKQYPKLKSQ